MSPKYFPKTAQRYGDRSIYSFDGAETVKSIQSVDKVVWKKTVNLELAVLTLEMKECKMKN